MIIDIETIFLTLIIIFLIYNYYNAESLSLIKYDDSNIFDGGGGYSGGYGGGYGNMNKKCRYISESYDNRQEIENILHSKESTFKKQPIVLDEFINNTDDKKVDESIPNTEILNDRYNPFIVEYNDDDLRSIINTDTQSNNSKDSTNNYGELLIEDLKKNMDFDMDSKLYIKSQRNQKLAKDSKTIASNFGRNALIETYKNDIDFYEKERTPWWEE